VIHAAVPATVRKSRRDVILLLKFVFEEDKKFSYPFRPIRSAPDRNSIFYKFDL
jgi:hypothetical protein